MIYRQLGGCFPSGCASVITFQTQALSLMVRKRISICRAVKPVDLPRLPCDAWRRIRPTDVAVVFSSSTMEWVFTGAPVAFEGNWQ